MSTITQPTCAVLDARSFSHPQLGEGRENARPAPRRYAYGDFLACIKE